MKSTTLLAIVAVAIAFGRCDCNLTTPRGTTTTITNSQSTTEGHPITRRGQPHSSPRSHTSESEGANRDIGNEEESSDEQTQSALGGLPNLGNTCYMNATLQVSARLGLFRCTANTDLDRSLGTVLGKLERGESVIKSEMKTLYSEIISLCGFGENSQQDAHELLSFLFDDNRASRDLIFKTKDSMECSMGHRWHRPETESKMLSIAISKPNMQANLDAHFAEENLNGANQVECTACGGTKRDARSSPRIEAPPQKLIIQLNRFSNDGATTSKIDTPISHVESIKLKKAWIAPSASPIVSEITYVLKGVIIHTGTLAGGHYYSWVKNPAGEWTEYNDEVVSKPTDLKGLENGYIYVYEKA